MKPLVPRRRGTLLTTRELAGLLGVCPTTVQRWVRAGRLRGDRIGKRYRFELGEIRMVFPILRRLSMPAILTRLAEYEAGRPVRR